MAESALFQTQHVSVASGSAVSETLNLKAFNIAGVFFPTVDSAGNCYVQVSFDTTSANFVRAFKADGSAAFAIATGAGSIAATLQDAIMPFPHARFEFDVAQTDTRTLTVTSKG